MRFAEAHLNTIQNLHRNCSKEKIGTNLDRFLFHRGRVVGNKTLRQGQRKSWFAGRGGAPRRNTVGGLIATPIEGPLFPHHWVGKEMAQLSTGFRAPCFKRFASNFPHGNGWEGRKSVSSHFGRAVRKGEPGLLIGWKQWISDRGPFVDPHWIFENLIRAL